MSIITIHILFLGIAFFQSIFIFVQWLFFRRREYLYYIAYIVSVIFFIYFRINKKIDSNWFYVPHWIEIITYQPLGIFGYWMYLRFAREFLNIKKTNPNLHVIINILEYVMIFFIIMFVALIPFHLNDINISRFYLVGYISLLAFAIPIFLIILREKDVLNIFLVAGCLLYVTGGCVGMAFNYFLNNFNGSNTIVFLGLEIGH